MQRKPMPGIGKIPNPPILRVNEGQSARQPQYNTQSHNYTASEAVPGHLSYNGMDQENGGLRDRRDMWNSPQPQPGHTTYNNAPSQTSLPMSAPSYAQYPHHQQSQQQSMPPRPPSTSSATFAENEPDAPGYGHGYADQPGYASSYDDNQQSGSTAPVLPTINSGEELDWGDLDNVVRHVDGSDPFIDARPRSMTMAYAQQQQQQQQLQQQSLPPPPPAMLAHGSSDTYAQGYDITDAYTGSSSVYSSYHDHQPSPTDPQGSYYPPSQAHTLSSHGHESGRSSGYTGLPTHYNAQGELIVDRYALDGSGDAYSSAVDTPPRHTIRSRSATPMGPGANGEYAALDEEGYEYDETDQTLDPEKEEYEDDYEDEYEEQPVQYYGAGTRLGYSEKMTPITEYPETPVTTQHYGPVPVGRITRRNKQKKRVQLTNGNLALELPVPTKLVLPLRREEEMLSTRYTAVTCDPDDFARNNFVLRQNLYGRSTEMFIVITMYNENEVLFCRTLHGVMQNISHLCTRKNSRTWGPDAWKKVVVCIVADGRKKIHPRVLDCLGALGVYQHGPFMQKAVTFKPVTAHLFEYTTSFGLDENLHFRYPDKGIVPMQILFCLKEKNAKKINSHRWFFNAFAPLLKPNVCVLIDVGTRPGHKSLYHLWKTFDLNSNVGGACGEIAAYKGRYWKGLMNPLVASQDFEYKISNILDKPTESFFGYISVLPGAFSAYRYIALQNNKNGVGPLASYFKGEVLHGRETDIFTSNMYLAEDRILCFELVAKEGHSWVLRYVKSAVGETDVPEALPEFISQRRRWLNGSFFASVYAIAHVSQIMRSGHSTARKISLMVETIYNVINLVFSWFSLGNFYLFFVIVTSSLEATSIGIPGIKYVNTVVQYTYASLCIACFLFSMGNKPKSAPWKYKITSILFAVLNVYAIASAIICAVQAASDGGTAYSVMVFSVLITYGVYLVSSLLALEPWHMITSFVPYMLFSPTYVNVLNIYAYSNLDDISWGTKQDTDVDTDLGAVISNGFSQVDVEILAEPSDIDQMYVETLANLRTRKPATNKNTTLTEGEKEQRAKDYYANIRSNVLLTWVLSNGVLLVAILSVGDPSAAFGNGANVTKVYMTFILSFVAITNIIRFLGSTLYMCAYILQG